jgi:hypothetical protein
MRKQFILCLATCVVVLAAAYQSCAQTVSLLTFTQYTFADKVNFSGGYGRIEEGFQWGLGIEAAFSEDKAFALVYQQMMTEATLQGTLISERADLGMHYIMGSAAHYQGIGPITGFAAIDLGACVLSPKDRPDLNNVTRFAWGARLGLGGGERVKIRVYGQVYSPVQSAGGGFYFGTGGSGVGVSTYSSLYQFGIGASLGFTLKEL